MTTLGTTKLVVLLLVVTAMVYGVTTSAPTPALAQDRPALVTRGKALFMEKGCDGCHRIGNVGASIAPDLSRAGAKDREADLARWLGTPSAQEPTQGGRVHELGPAARDITGVPHHMPKLELSEAEAQALAAYLVSLP